ncbi:MAG TPA: HAMP domain-containing sensor histidine kinase [bacterium]|nr:HAMP domain-containing sensor histidine kinase [bacterium]
MKLSVRSLRVRAFLVVLAVGVSPLIFVYLSGFFETGMGARLLGNVRKGADETADLLQQSSMETETLRASVDAIAASHDVRIRVLDASGRVELDIDREKLSGLWRTISDVWYGPGGVPSLESYDRTLGAIVERPEVREARARGHATGCRTAGGASLVCEAVRLAGTRIVYVQDAAPRAIGAFSDLRDQLGRLTLFVLPAVMLLAWWLGWRFVVPIENLREQILAKAATVSPRADVGLERRDEFAELAAAFNDLLGALQARAKENEAFVADLAHEFKNPVAAVRAAGESLDRGAIDAERAARLASVLKESGRKLDALVTQFLELARAEAGLPEEPRTRVDLGAMARGMADAFSRDERWPKTKFEATHEGAGAAVVSGVAGRLESALRNLVNNAASFSGDAGVVRIATSVDARDAIVRVIDNGPGIAPEDLPRVFDRFFSTRHGRGGTGLGLALVRAVVEGHGGTIRAIATPGGGATFEIRLPLAGSTGPAA